MNIHINKHPMIKSTKPYTRWWWFSGPIGKEEIDEQLDWLVTMGFGGVEIAWVYPLPETPKDAGPEFLSPQWQEIVSYAIEGCKQRGLGCDLTFGSLWPFGGSFVPESYGSKNFTGLSPKRIRKAWESRYNETPGLVIDHLNKEALGFYSTYLLERGFSKFASQHPMAFFLDSLEIDMEGLATDGFLDQFIQRFGYDLSPYIHDLDQHPQVRFDYRTLIADLLLEEFYVPYTEMCHQTGALSRIQCHGSLTDLLWAFGTADIPETEALLFDPDFTLIPASAAAFHGKPLVTSESFTCLYGWVSVGNDPPYLGKEDPLDVKVQADAQFASGLNQILWHGMPFSTQANPRKFYASVHVGPDGNLSDDLPKLNEYFTKVSQWNRFGKPVTQLGVYLPLEDQWVADRLPVELHKPSNEYHWELQEVKMPKDLLGHRPLWISEKFLELCQVSTQVPGGIQCGEQLIPALYIDAEWLSLNTLNQLLRLARDGAHIILKQVPKEPGFISHDPYQEHLEELISLTKGTPLPAPIIKSSIPLEFWCTKLGEEYHFFFAHPGTQGMRYPLEYQFWKSLTPVDVQVTFFLGNQEYNHQLHFQQASALMVSIQSDPRTITIEQGRI